MANLVVAGVCNLGCAYCFAPPQRWRTAGRFPHGPFLSLEAFNERLDFLDRSGIAEARLIGGEPTLHPQFAELIRQARQRGKRVLVFTHGLIPAAALACLEALPGEACTALVNINASRDGGEPTAAEIARRFETLRRLGPRAMPGFTIFRADFQLDWLLEAIQETGCRPAIRLGLAQPALSARNQALHPRQYRFVGQKIAQFAGRAGQRGVRLEFDCGFVRCMFSAEDLERLDQAHSPPALRCNPILDIDLDGQAAHCFPLAGKIQARLEGDSTAQELRERLAAQARPFRAAGIYRECSTCPYKQGGECTGGCLASALRQFRRAPNRVTIPAGRG